MNPATQALRAAIGEALARLGEPRIRDDAVHDARKALMRARAALRLLRCGLDGATYRAQNALLRDAARALAPMREARSMLDALATLREHAAGALRPAEVERVARHLRAEKAAAARDFAARRAALAKCIRLLEHSLARAGQPDFSAVGPEPLAEGMRRIYRKGRRALAEARKLRAPETLHEWRKQTKYLLNALETLHGAPQGKAKKAVRRAGKRAKKVADRLGDDHDLNVLARKARAPQRLQQVIERRREKLQARAFALGRKLYGRKPGDFVRKIA